MLIAHVRATAIVHAYSSEASRLVCMASESENNDVDKHHIRGNASSPVRSLEVARNGADDAHEMSDALPVEIEIMPLLRTVGTTGRQGSNGRSHRPNRGIRSSSWLQSVTGLHRPRRELRNSIVVTTDPVESAGAYVHMYELGRLLEEEGLT